MPTPTRRLARALTAACVLALLAAIVAVLPDSSHPPERVAAAAPEYSGPTSDLHDELAAAVGQAQLAAWYSAASQPSPPVVSVPRTPEPRTAPAPRTTTAPAASGDVLAAIAAHFGDIYDQAVGVAQCESSLDPAAISGGNYGLFQINEVHRDRVEAMGYSWSQILDPNVNAAVARAIYDEQGWGPWACRWAARG